MNRIMVTVLLLSLTACASTTAFPQDTEMAFIQQYESIRASIAVLPESMDKYELRLLLDSAGTRFSAAGTDATEIKVAWSMLARVAALLAETQGASTANAASSVAAPKVMLAAPVYLLCVSIA